MLGDPELLRFTRVPEPAPPGFARTWLDRYEEARRDGSREAFASVDETGTFLGLALALVGCLRLRSRSTPSKPRIVRLRLSRQTGGGLD